MLAHFSAISDVDTSFIINMTIPLHLIFSTHLYFINITLTLPFICLGFYPL